MRIATLTLNPCLDRTLYFQTPFQRGALNRAGQSMTHASGKGINSAMVLRELDVPVTAIGFCGGGGAPLSEALSVRGIAADLIPTSAPMRMCIKLIDADGICTEANECGGPITDAECEALLLRVRAFVQSCAREPDGGILIAGGSIPQGVKKEIYYEIGCMLWGTNVRFVLDADGDALRLGLPCRPSLIKPNLYELSQLTQRALCGREDVAAAAKHAAQQSGASVICTMGAEGAVLVSPDRHAFAVTAPQVQAQSFAGAGDTFLAAYLWSVYVCGDATEDALRAAASAAAAKVEKPGTEIPTKEEMIRYTDQISVIPIP